MFVGREDEIEELNRLYKAKKSNLVVVYGRRRIGKSTLVDNLCAGKRALKFEGLEGVRSVGQISNFTRDLSAQIEDPLLKHMTFLDWNGVFDYLTEQINKSNKKIILFFDEFQWMSANQSKLVSILKKVWDNQWKKSNKVMLVLCGSVASFMVEKVVKSSALYGRIDYELALGGLDPHDIQKLVGGKRSPEEIFMYILIFGGVPRYFEIIDPKISFEQNLHELFFKRNSLLLNEYEKVFYSQFKEHKNYEKIIQFLSRNPAPLNEVASHLNMESSGGVKSYLDNLEKALFISSYVPFNRAENSKLKKYKLTDEYIRFYLKYVLPNKKQIQSAPKNQNLFKQLVKDKWGPWLGFAFENFCLKNGYLLAQKMGFADQVKSFGPLFSKGDKGFQIDLIFERSDNVITICEMKFYNKEISTSIIIEIEKKLALLKVKKGVTVEKALISQFGADKKLKASEYFHHELTVGDIMKCQ